MTQHNPPTMMRAIQEYDRKGVRPQRRPCSCGMKQTRICICYAKNQYIWKCRYCGKKEK